MDQNTFFDTAGRVIEVDNASPARIVRVGGWNSAGAPSGGAFGVNRFKAILHCLFNQLLHGVQVDLTVALNINVGIKGKLECLRNINQSNAIGIDTRNSSML